jgi:hypothetical protein
MSSNEATVDPELTALVNEPDAGPRLVEFLREKHAIPDGEGENPVWDFAAGQLMSHGRLHEALLVYWEHYLAVLSSQISTNRRLHKGLVLVRLSDCFRMLGFPVHEKRYLMLTLCEDAITSSGNVAKTTGIYPRLVWGGLSESSLKRYAKEFFDLSAEHPAEALFPEALLQRLDDDWLTEFPSGREVSFFRINPLYVRHRLDRLGDGTGKTLELLAQYLMSCMPGCRTRARLLSGSTDYDVVCAMEGFDLDFRSEFGRHFVCECKDWDKPADFSVMAKFGRILESTKSKFGILFSKDGITGTGKMKDAKLEQLKYFQQTGNVIVVLGLQDLKRVADGANLIALLRNQYETVRLDLRTTQARQPKKPRRPRKGQDARKSSR